MRTHRRSDQSLVYESGEGYEATLKKGEEIIKELVTPGTTFLDIGCGFGRFYPAVAATSRNYTGIDFSEEMIAEAQKRYPDGNFVCSDFKHWVGEYDVVFECIVLSSFDGDVHAFSRNLMKNVKAGGRLILVEPGEVQVIVKEDTLGELIT